MPEPLVSILTPVYNQEAYIERTIRSVLNQTYRNWEWIIIDDGSSDGTADIISSYKDKRIRYYYREHGGIDTISLRHNEALRLSTGDFVALIDGDDLWPEYKLERQLESFSDKGVVLSYGECRLIDSVGREIYYARIPREETISRNNPVGSALRELLLNINSFTYNPTVLIRRSAIEEIGGFTAYNGLAHDFPTWCALALEGTFDPVLSCLGFWRRHTASLTFLHSKYRFMNKIAFVAEFSRVHAAEIKTLGIDPKTIETHLGKRLAAYMKHFDYDNAFLLAALGKFTEAELAFDKFVENNPSLKNRCMRSLFSLSRLINFDSANPARKFKEKINGKSSCR